MGRSFKGTHFKVLTNKLGYYQTQDACGLEDTIRVASIHPSTFLFTCTQSLSLSLTHTHTHTHTHLHTWIGRDSKCTLINVKTHTWKGRGWRGEIEKISSCRISTPLVYYTLAGLGGKIVRLNIKYCLVLT